MGRTLRLIKRTPGFGRATLVLLCIGIVMVSSQPVRTDPQNALHFFRNYFVTGDYAVGGVGLRTIDGTADDQDGLADGFATRTIHFSAVNGNAVPADANILAAFLYWQTVVTTSQGSATDGAQFRGQNITATINSVEVTTAELLNPAGTAPCWSNGGAAGAPDGAHRMLSYRADVLRFLPRALINGNPVGKPLVNDEDLVANMYAPGHTVRLPDAGSGNQVPVTNGATLVVIYRNPDPGAQLRSI